MPDAESVVSDQRRGRRRRLIVAVAAAGLLALLLYGALETAVPVPPSQSMPGMEMSDDPAGRGPIAAPGAP